MFKKKNYNKKRKVGNRRGKGRLYSHKHSQTTYDFRGWFEYDSVLFLAPDDRKGGRIELRNEMGRRNLGK